MSFLASSGADGSVRMFDLRHLEHSTIIYEDPSHVPLLRLAWNKQDPNYLSTMAMDASEVSVLPGFSFVFPVVVLNRTGCCGVFCMQSMDDLKPMQFKEQAWVWVL